MTALIFPIKKAAPGPPLIVLAVVRLEVIGYAHLAA